MDLVLAKFAREFHVPAWGVEPNLVAHIGRVTSLNATKRAADPDGLLFHKGFDIAEFG